MKKQFIKAVLTAAVIHCSLFIIHSANAADRHWRGGTDASAANAANWAENAVPATGDAIILDSGSAAMTWDIDDVTPASWTQTVDYTGTVTFQTGISRKANGDDKVAHGVLDTDGVTRVLKVTGDVTVNGGVWTHEANPAMSSSEESWTDGKGIYRLIADIGGNLTVGTNAQINVSDKGYMCKNGPGFRADSGGAHGAPGTLVSWAYSTSGVCAGPYGSTKAPCTLGSGGGPSATSSSDGTAGGGAIILTVAGKTTLNGELRADVTAETPHYAGAGGAVCIRTGTIESSDTSVISARGGRISTGGSNYAPGSGGRVAVILTESGADFTNFSRANVSALGNTCSSNWHYSSNGTVYFEKPSDNGIGELYIRGYDNCFQLGYGAVVCDSSERHFRKVTFSNKGQLIVADETVFEVDEGLERLDATENRVYMQGGTLKGTGATLLVNGVRLYATLHRAGSSAVFRDSGIVTAGNGTGTVVITNVTAIVDNKLSFNANLELATGAKITCANYTTVTAKYPGASPETSMNLAGNTNGVELVVNGNLTVPSGAQISVDALGMPAASGLGKPQTAAGYQGASHGGCASGSGTETALVDNMPPTYGSIYAPADIGSGSSGHSGGGRIRLTVTGTLCLDGRISAVGGKTEPPNGGDAGSGGSIWIDAGVLTTPAGTGVIAADGGKVGASTYRGGSGGGRVAVALTGTGSTFDTFRNAGGIISAYGSLATIGGKLQPYGGAGTVYLRLPGQGEHEGTLVIDNGGSEISPSCTLISSQVTDTEVGSVLLKGNGVLAIENDSSLTVTGNWTSEPGAKIEDRLGKVIFAGSGNSVISGTNEFVKIECLVPGKQLVFGCGEGDVFKVLADGQLRFEGGEGDGEKLVLKSSTPGTQWKIAVEDGAEVKLANLDVSDSDATEGVMLSAEESIGDGANNDNWAFVNIVYGQVITWTGASGTVWGNAMNWDLGRPPVPTDNVVISQAGNMPEVAVDVDMLGLDIAAGMTLTVNGHLTISNALHSAGTIAGSGTVILSGATADVGSGNWNFANGTLVVNGGQTTQLSLNNAEIGTVILDRTGGTLTFPTSLRPAVFMADGVGTLAFANDVKLTADEFRVNGLSLSGTSWYLDVKRLAKVTNVTVDGSDASAGIPINAGTSQAGGVSPNVNWNFNGTFCEWKHDAASGDFHTAANWVNGTVPGTNDMVVIGAGATVTAASAVSVGNLFIEGGTATFAAELAVGDSLEVLDGSVLSLNRPSTVGDRVVVRAGAKLTHENNADNDFANGTAKTFDLTVGGDMVVEPGVNFTVRGKGTSHGIGSGYGKGGAGSGASHGGIGSDAGAPAMSGPCYDAIKRPSMVGSGYSGRGGGAVKLTVGGTLSLDSTIDAEGAHINAQYSGSGGSIWLTCGKLIGSGNLDADGGRTHNNYWRGGGGRIAVWQTAATGLDNYTGTMTTYGGQVDNGQGIVANTIKASGGTVYLHDQNDPEDGGRLIIDYKNGSRTANGNYPDQLLRTDFPSMLYGDEGNAPFANMTLILKRGAALNLKSNVKIKHLVVEQPTPKTDSKPVVRCNGYTLTVRGPTPAKVVADTMSKLTKSTSDTVYANGKTAVVTELGGEIKWIAPKTILILR